MTENVYTLTQPERAIFDAKLADQTPEAKELIQLFTWVAAKQDIPDFIFIMVSPLLGAMTKFVEQNYTWNGTRTLFLENEEDD